MKKRAPTSAGHSPEFKGVVKKITGRLTNDGKLEREGQEEMQGRSLSKPATAKSRANPDPRRRG
jgi:uncharacterized protein YjbJ (UPF0337 family)